MFYALMATVLKNVIYEADAIGEDVLPEGEASATDSESNSSEAEGL